MSCFSQLCFRKQNLYAYLFKEVRDVDLDTLNIIAVYKDWQEGSALRDRNYPQQQVIQYQLEKWAHKQQEEFFDHKLDGLISCAENADNDLPVCSREERWERHQGGETVHYGILKNRVAKRATKLVQGGTLDEAVEIANGLKGMSSESVIEIRYAVPKRCKTYCDVCEKCNWYQEWCKKNVKGEINDYINFKT